MKTLIQLLNCIPTIICCGSANRNTRRELRKLSLTRYEKGKWRATFLLDDIGDKYGQWTDDGVFVKDIPTADGKSLLDVLQKLIKKIEKLKN